MTYKVRITSMAMNLPVSFLVNRAKEPLRYRGVKKVRRPSKRSLRRQLGRMRAQKWGFDVSPISYEI